MTHGSCMKATMSLSFMLNEATLGSPDLRMMSIAVSTGDSFLSVAICARGLADDGFVRSAADQELVRAVTELEVTLHVGDELGMHGGIGEVLPECVAATAFCPAWD